MTEFTISQVVPFGSVAVSRVGNVLGRIKAAYVPANSIMETVALANDPEDETAYLMRSPANARHLLASIRELRAGKGEAHELTDG